MLLPFATALLLLQPPPARDTIRLEVGSPQVDGRVYQPHAARVRVRIGSDTARVVSEWTNELSVGDSAGRQVHRWVTRGTQNTPGGPVSWELRQTFDARTLAPLGYHRTASNGMYARYAIDGNRVRGVRKLPADRVESRVDVTVPRMGFIASASDLVPLAVGLREGTVMTAPVWGPNMPDSDLRVFTVVGRSTMNVEGTRTAAWKVEERRHADRSLTATWYLVEGSPYMVYGEVPLPNGTTQLMSEVEIPRTAR